MTVCNICLSPNVVNMKDRLELCRECYGQVTEMENATVK